MQGRSPNRSESDCMPDVREGFLNIKRQGIMAVEDIALGSATIKREQKKLEPLYVNSAPLCSSAEARTDWRIGNPSHRLSNGVYLPKNARHVILNRSPAQEEIGCFIHLQPVSRGVEAQIHKQSVQRRDAWQCLYFEIEEFTQWRWICFGANLAKAASRKFKALPRRAIRRTAPVQDKGSLFEAPLLLVLIGGKRQEI